MVNGRLIQIKSVEKRPANPPIKIKSNIPIFMPLSLQFFVFLLIKSFYEKICNLKRDWSQMNDISTDSQGTFFKIEY